MEGWGRLNYVSSSKRFIKEKEAYWRRGNQIIENLQHRRKRNRQDCSLLVKFLFWSSRDL